MPPFMKLFKQLEEEKKEPGPKLVSYVFLINMWKKFENDQTMY